jgi:hypothetical protein
MKNILLLITLSALSTQIYSQEKNYHFDTLIVEIDEQIKVKIASYSMVWLNHYEGFSSRLEQFQKDVSTIRNDIPSDKNILIESGKVGEITLNIVGDCKNYMLNKSEDSYRINKAIIRAGKYEIFIEFQDIDNFLLTDIQKRINQVTTIHEKDTEEHYGPLEFTAEVEKKVEGLHLMFTTSMKMTQRYSILIAHVLTT